MEENSHPIIALTDEERFPLLSDLSLLNALKQDPYAPRFNFQSGDKLQASHLDQLRAYREHIKSRAQIEVGVVPEWLSKYIEECTVHVPYYQNRTVAFSTHPTINRERIRLEPWNFVSNRADIKELLVYYTSGTTGPPMDVNFSPVAQASWIPQMESLLTSLDIHFSHDPKQVAIAQICDQISTLTYSSLSTYLSGSGILKINLNLADWNAESDRIHFLEKYNPEILTGDPFSFLALKRLNANITPKAMISSAMKLSEELHKELSEYFNCPILDIYSLTECRNIAVKQGDEYKSIRPDIFIEIFDPTVDKCLTDGEHGEIVITGGSNPFLPLIRYRTGDYGKLRHRNGIQYLYDLEAREPVMFATDSGADLNNIDVSRAFVKLAIAGFELHQHKDLSVRCTIWAEKIEPIEVEALLRALFGEKFRITIHVEHPKKMIKGKKPVNYTRDFDSNSEEALPR